MTAGAREVILEARVPQDLAEQRLDVVLAALLEEPRSRSQTRLAAGEVLLDGALAAKSSRVPAGAVIVVVAPPPPPAPLPAPDVPVRWEDEHLAVVAKPPGLVVHRGAGTPPEAPTLVSALRAAGMPLAESGDGDRPGIVHRLDRGTSGLLVVAKTPAVLEALAKAFRRHDVTRRYWALVEGTPDPARAVVDAPLARSPRDRTRFRTDPAGRRAVSEYAVEQSFGRASVVTVTLETGRTHQVRVHMAAVGHPVAGDRHYGASPALATELGLERPALHARQLGFAHPVTGAMVEVDEPLPADLGAAIAVLSG